MEQLGNDFETALASAITTAGQTTFDVASSTGAPAPSFRVRIDDELMLVTAVAHPTWTVTRGIEGTTATTHSNGAAVYHVVTKGGLDTYARESLHMVKQVIAEGDVLVIPADHTMLVGNNFKLDGYIQIDGELHMVT